MEPTNKTQSPATTPAPPTTSPESPNNATPATAPPSSSTNTPQQQQQQQQPTTTHKKLQKKPRSNSIIGRFTLFAKLGPPLPQRHSRRATTSDAERALAAKERMSVDDYREARLSRSASASSGSRYSRSEHDMARQEPEAGAGASAQHDAGRHREDRSTAESSSPRRHSRGESPSPPAVAEGPRDEVVCSDNGLRARVEHKHHDHAPDNATGSGKQPQGSRPRIDSATVPEGSPAVVRHHHHHHHHQQQRQREGEDDQNDRPRQSAVHDEEHLLNRGHDDAHSEAKPVPTKGDEGAVGKLRAKSQRYREKGREKLAKTFFHRGSDGKKEAAESKAEN